MLTDAIIRDAAGKQAFARGERLVAEGAVASWHAEPDGPDAGAVELTGTVVERGEPFEGVAVGLDLAAGTAVLRSCPCRKAGPGGAPCKHGVALALAWLDARRAPNALDAPIAPTGGPGALPPDAVAALKAQTQELLARYRREADAARDGGRPFPTAPHVGTVREPQTSPRISRLVWSYTAAQARDPEGGPGDAGGPDAAGSSLEPVDLYPTIVAGGRVPGAAGAPDGRVWGLHLRIGTSRAAYRVRQVPDLVRAWESGEHRAWGRDLAFAHTPAAFTERANGLLALVSRVWHTQEAARSAGRDEPADPLYGVNAKQLPLSDRDACDLLDLMQGSSVRFEPRAACGAKPCDLAVVAGNPDPALGLAVVPGARGGYDLRLPADADCVLSADRMYLLHAGHAWRCSDAYRERMGELCRAALPASAPLHVRATDMPGLCASVLPAIRDCARLDLPAELDGMLPTPPALSFKVALTRSFATCTATASYAGRAVDLFAPVRPGQPVRDAAAERAARRAVRAFFPQALPAPSVARGRPRQEGADERRRGPRPWPTAADPDGTPCFPADDAAALYRLLAEGLPRLAELGDVRVSDNLRAARVRRPPRVRVAASVADGLLDLAVDADGLSPEDLLAYLASFQRRQRFVRLPSGDVMRLEDSGVAALAELAEALGVDARSLVEGTAHLPANRAPFVDALMKRAEGVRLDRDEGFRRIVRAFDTIGDSDFTEPASLRGTLRPYQREGFKWISSLAELGFGGILADDMGLGKTLQVIAYLLARREAGEELPALVVCPASLVYNWTAELARFAPALRSAAVAGTREGRRAAIEGTGADGETGADVLVTSYELLKRDINLYTGRRFSTMALDEAQYIKNHATQAARCAKQVEARVRLALTGTPVENRLSELWSIFDFLMPGLLGTHASFRRRFEIPIEEGDARAAERLQALTGPFILRRMKGDVLKDLPDKTESLVTVPLEGEQGRLYRATEAQLALALSRQLPHEFAAQRVAVLAELTKLRQICCDPHLLYENYEGGAAKLETCLDLVLSAVDGGHKVLVFSQFTSMLSIIARRLDEKGVRHTELVGDTPKEERARRVSAFATDETPVFLISLKAGGVGLNLTAADIVIHYDPWWNLAAQDQATDRAHRIGQTKAVTVLRLIAKDTVEERMVRLQEAKRGLAELAVGGTAAASTRLTREDILALLDA